MEVVDPIISLATEIYKLVENVKANEERCHRVSDQVRALEELVRSIKQRGARQISSDVAKALRRLCKTLASAQQLIKKYTTANAMKRIMRQNNYTDEFNSVNEQLKDAFLILSGALQVEQGNILYKVFEKVDQRDDNKCKCIIYCTVL